MAETKTSRQQLDERWARDAEARAEMGITHYREGALVDAKRWNALDDEGRCKAILEWYAAADEAYAALRIATKG